MDGAIIYLFIAVLSAFTLSFLLVFHMPSSRWMDSIGLTFGALGSVGLFYLFVLINEGPRASVAENSAKHSVIRVAIGGTALP